MRYEMKWMVYIYEIMTNEALDGNVALYICRGH